MPRSPLLLAAALALGSGCAPSADAPEPSPTYQPTRSASSDAPPDPPPADPPAVPPGTTATLARADLEPVGDAEATGRVVLTDTPDGLLFSVDMSGLESEGLMALHVHEGGSCARPGGLFNPDGAPLGGPMENADRRPAGGAGNVIARESGDARYEHVDPLLTLGEGRNVLGRVAVLHARQDDYHTPPEGDPGPIVACGVILPH